MTTHEIVDLFLGLLMQILELVNGRELCHVETIGQNSIRLSLQQVFRLKSGDVRDGCEYVTSMRRGSLNAVAMVYTTLPGLGIHIKPLKIVVEVDRASTEIATQKSSVSSEDGRHIDSSLLGEGQSNASQPFVEVGYDSLLFLVADELHDRCR
jgi:hypothetical protein